MLQTLVVAYIPQYVSFLSILVFLYTSYANITIL